MRLCLLVLLLVVGAPALAASGRQPAPPGSFPGAPAQFTHFSTEEIVRGFMALAFGSDLRVGAAPKGTRRFTHEIRAYVVSAGSIDRKAAMERIISEYNAKIPNLRVSIAPGESSANLIVHLIDERNFQLTLEQAFGRATAQAFIDKTDPQCMTSVRSQADGEIVRALSFVIVDKTDNVFLDCAYHELLHAFGLSNHDQRNPWTTLNQNRMVGYLSVYDRALLTLLYDPQLGPGLSRGEARAILPRLIKDLGLAAVPARTN